MVVTDPGSEADGAVAIHAGAEDHLVRGAIRGDCCRARCATRSRSAGCGGSCPPPTTSPGCPTSGDSRTSPSTTCAWPIAAGRRSCSCSCGSRARHPTTTFGRPPRCCSTPSATPTSGPHHRRHVHRAALGRCSGRGVAGALAPRRGHRRAQRRPGSAAPVVAVGRRRPVRAGSSTSLSQILETAGRRMRERVEG